MPSPSESDQLSPRAALLFDIAKSELSIATTAETQRERFVFVVTVITGFLVASVGWDADFGEDDLWQALFLIVLGFFGILQVMKLHTKKLHHFNRFRAFRDEIDRSYMDGMISSLKKLGDQQFERERPKIRFDRIPSQYLWATIPAASFGIGLFVLSRVLSSISGKLGSVAP